MHPRRRSLRTAGRGLLTPALAPLGHDSGMLAGFVARVLDALDLDRVVLRQGESRA